MHKGGGIRYMRGEVVMRREKILYLESTCRPGYIRDTRDENGLYLETIPRPRDI